jgi:RNA polymerase sigma-B factor
MRRAVPPPTPLPAARHSVLDLRNRWLVARLARCGDDGRREALQAELVVTNLRLADTIARRYRHRGIAYDDLKQVAYEGLVKAARRFDPGLGCDFASYAVPVVRGEVRRHFRDQGWLVRPPRGVQELQWEITQTTDQLRSDLGREPERGEIVEAVGADEDDYTTAAAASSCFRPLSLDEPVGTDGSESLGDLLTDEHDHLAPAEARALLTGAMPCLTVQDRRILELRFFEDRSQQEIGDRLGLSPMQVSRAMRRILMQLRVAIGRPQPAAGRAGARGDEDDT